MKKSELIQKQLKVLQETKEYYEQDTQGRRCTDGEICMYNPSSIGKQETSEGCAIGRLLTPELKEQFDTDFRGGGVSSDKIFNSLPQDIRELGQGFLTRLQDFHDTEHYWNADGLTNVGNDVYEETLFRITEEVYLKN